MVSRTRIETLCDLHNAQGEEREGATVGPLRFGPLEGTVDLCPDCQNASLTLDEWGGVLYEYGVDSRGVRLKGRVKEVEPVKVVGPFECPKCEATYTTRQSFRKHLNDEGIDFAEYLKSIGETPFPCDGDDGKCNFVGIDEPGLKLHKRVHDKVLTNGAQEPLINGHG